MADKSLAAARGEGLLLDRRHRATPPDQRKADRREGKSTLTFRLHYVLLRVHGGGGPAQRSPLSDGSRHDLVKGES